MSKGSDTRQTILREAGNLASINGLSGVTIGALASHTGMSKSGLFRHFGSKDELQVATLKATIDRFIETVVRPALHTPRGLPRVRVLFERWLAWATGAGLPGGCLFIAASVELDDHPGQARDYLVETQHDWLELLATCGRKAVETGEFRTDLDCDQFAHEFNSILLGFHQAHRLLRDPGAAVRASRQFDRLVEDALNVGTHA
jgi:AcrR family transcriptional regulator